MSALDRVAGMGLETYDPTVVIDAVQTLQVLGREQALRQASAAAVDARESGSRGVGLFWVLRVLFEVSADTGFPPVLLGRPSLPSPADSAAIPRFPIMVVNDVPLLIVRAYDLAGIAQEVEDHIAFFRDRGFVRDRPLMPPQDLATVEPHARALLRSAYPAGATADAESFIDEQLRRAGER